tara:strand:- start:4750 stop:5007 length:258 start_codon:yes stop_codon:yes gene_type:complete
MPRPTGSKNLPKYRYRVEVKQEDEENDVYYFCTQKDISDMFHISRITIHNRIHDKFNSPMIIEKLAYPKPAVRIERTAVFLEYNE